MMYMCSSCFHPHFSNHPVTVVSPIVLHGVNQGLATLHDFRWILRQLDGKWQQGTCLVVNQYLGSTEVLPQLFGRLGFWFLWGFLGCKSNEEGYKFIWSLHYTYICSFYIFQRSLMLQKPHT